MLNIMESDLNQTGVPSTTAPTDDSLSPVEKFSLVVYCVIFVVGTTGNGLVIYVTGFKMKKSINSIWFLNLALADFLFTAFLIFQIIYVSQGYIWPFGDIMCKLSSLVNGINMFASIFLMMAISLDRCLCTWVVVWAQNKRTPLKAQLACVTTWLAALACSIPNAISRQVENQEGAYHCLKSASMNKILTVFQFVFGFLVPFLIITMSYIAISIRARRLQRGMKRKSLRIIIAIVLTFFICWLPYHMLNILSEIDLIIYDIAEILVPLSVNLAFLNSCLNPILYVFMCDEFLKNKWSLCFVLESVLAEDHPSFGTLSRISRRSDSTVPIERKDTFTLLSSNNQKPLTDNVYNTRDPQGEIQEKSTTSN